MRALVSALLVVAASAAALPARGQTIAKVPVQKGIAGGDVVVPLTLKPPAGASAMDFRFTYDAAVVTPTGMFTTSTTDAFTLVPDLSTPGVVHLTMAGPALAGSVETEVAWLTFRVVGANGTSSGLSWTACAINGGAIPCTTTNGRIDSGTGTVKTRVPDTPQAAPGATLKVPVTVDSISGVDSIQITVKFNPTIVNATLIEKTPLSNPLSLTQNVSTPGTARAVLFGTNAISGNGNLLLITFQVVGTLGESTPLNLTEALYNEFAVSSVLDDGLFTICTSADVDGDGRSVCSDCNDLNPAVYPNAPEICDGIDNQCPGDTGWAQIDEGATISFYRDADGDGYGTASDVVQACSAPAGYVADSTDCNDSSASIHPGAAELCNVVDDDCSATTADGSGEAGYGSPCDGSDADLCAEGSLDCQGGPGLTCSDANDADPEVCNALDDDCNPATADGSSEPGYGLACDGSDADACLEGVLVCSGGPGLACDDANDADPELCNGLDDDCDGSLPVSERDDDADGYRPCTGDCNDSAASVHPGAAEACDSIDADCDGSYTDATCDDLDFCTSEICAPAGPSAAACAYVFSGACAVAGHVTYYRDSDDAPGTDDGSDKGVPGVSLALEGYETATVTSSNPTGAFTSAAGGDVTVAPQPLLGNWAPPDDPTIPGTECRQPAVTGLDASWISRFSVSALPLSASQQVAGDVSGDHTISSYDAALTAQFVVRLIQRFPAGEALASDWAFLPASAARSVHNADATGVDFAGILYGDVTGNWGELCPFEALAPEASPETGEATAAGSKDAGPVALASARNPEGPGAIDPPAVAEIFLAAKPLRVSTDAWELTLAVAGGSGILGLDLELRHDASVIIQEARVVDAAAHFAKNQNDVKGRFLLSLYGATPLRDSGSILVLRVLAADGKDVLTRLALRARANEGRIQVRHGAGLTAAP